MTVEAVSAASFADVMAELPSGVAVITTRGATGPMGLAVTSLSPYTAEPPSVMVSIAHGSRSCGPLLEAEQFGVHLLHRSQEAVAAAFVSRSDDKFAGLDWDWDAGVPRIEGTLAYMRCAREASFAHLDHSVLIGTIAALESAPAAEPLLYLRRRFSWRLLDHSPAS